MLFYDVDFAKINAKYHEEKLVGQMQDSNADFDYVVSLFHKVTATVNSWMQPKATNEISRPIGDIQASLR